MSPIKQSYTSFRKSMSYKMVNVFVYLFVSLFVTDCESLTNFFYYSLCNRQDTISQVHSYTGKFFVHHYLSFCLTRRSSSPEMLHKKGVLKISQTRGVFFQESCKIRLPETCKSWDLFFRAAILYRLYM